jgi:hypothetical protein
MSASHAAGSARSGECHKYSVLLLRGSACSALIQTLDFMEIDIILGGYTSPEARNPSAALMATFARSHFSLTSFPENSNRLSEKLSTSYLTPLQIFCFRPLSFYNTIFF